MAEPTGVVSRRAVVAGATVLAAVGVALPACAVYDSSKKPAAPAPGAPSGAAAAPLAKAADIPVGGGTIFADQQTVVTQPTAGTFAAFDTTCTHQGCTVAEVADGTIDCPCHGSKYAIADGSVANGPASKPLGRKNITVADGAITLA